MLTETISRVLEQEQNNPGLFVCLFVWRPSYSFFLNLFCVFSPSNPLRVRWKSYRQNEFILFCFCFRFNENGQRWGSSSLSAIFSGQIRRLTSCISGPINPIDASSFWYCFARRLPT